jgi:hypothetical protein
MARVAAISTALPVEGVPELVDSFLGPNLYDLGPTVGDLHVAFDNDLCALVSTARVDSGGPVFSFPRRVGFLPMDYRAAATVSWLASADNTWYRLLAAEARFDTGGVAGLELLQYDTVMSVADALPRFRRNLLDRLRSFYTGWNLARVTRSGRMTLWRNDYSSYWPYWIDRCRYLLSNAPVTVFSRCLARHKRVMVIAEPADVPRARQIFPSVFGDAAADRRSRKRARVSE